MTHEFEYLPIESAPKNCSIVLYCPRRKQWRKGQWNAQEHHKKPRPYWTTWETFVDSDRNDQPIYWTTLLALVPEEAPDEI